MYLRVVLYARRALVCVCVCARACARVRGRRQDSGGAANVGALCRLVNARRDVTGQARLTKWTSFAKSAAAAAAAIHFFFRPFRRDPMSADFFFSTTPFIVTQTYNICPYNIIIYAAAALYIIII